MSATSATTTAAATASDTRERMVRAITMKFFHGGLPPGATKGRDLAFEVLTEAQKPDPKPIVAGVVIGRVSGFKEKAGKLPNGEASISILLTGAFEATRASDGATMEAPGMYLPPLFSDYAQAALNGGAKAVDFAIEVCVEKNPRAGGVAYVWVIHNLLRQVEVTPLDRIRAQMQKHNLVTGSGEPVKVALPPPDVSPTIEHDPETGEIATPNKVASAAAASNSEPTSIASEPVKSEPGQTEAEKEHAKGKRKQAA